MTYKQQDKKVDHDSCREAHGVKMIGGIPCVGRSPTFGTIPTKEWNKMVAKARDDINLETMQTKSHYYDNDTCRAIYRAREEGEFFKPFDNYNCIESHVNCFYLHKYENALSTRFPTWECTCPGIKNPCITNPDIYCKNCTKYTLVSIDPAIGNEHTSNHTIPVKRIKGGFIIDDLEFSYKNIITNDQIVLDKIILAILSVGLFLCGMFMMWILSVML